MDTTSGLCACPDSSGCQRRPETSKSRAQRCPHLAVLRAQFRVEGLLRGSGSSFPSGHDKRLAFPVAGVTGIERPRLRVWIGGFGFGMIVR